jgi:hypothetical protein
MPASARGRGAEERCRPAALDGRWSVGMPMTSDGRFSS